MSKEFKSFIKLNDLKHARTSVNHPQSNGKLEAFHGNIKTECIRAESFIDLEDARAKVAEYIRKYNHQRLHSGIGFVTPFDMLTGRAEQIFKERDDKLQNARQRRKENYHEKYRKSA